MCGNREKDSQRYAAGYLKQSTLFFWLFFKDSDIGWNCKERRVLAERLLSTNILSGCVHLSFTYNLGGVSW